MDSIPDIMVHCIPNEPNFKKILIKELQRYSIRFGHINALLIVPSRTNFQCTNYAFLRYENQSIHQEAVQFLNQQKILGTQIWFELNHQQTQQHRMLQDTPASRRVAIQLERLEQVEREMNVQHQAQLDELNRVRNENEQLTTQVLNLTNQVHNLEVSQQIDRELINQYQEAQTRREQVEQGLEPDTQVNIEFMPISEINPLPTVKKPNFVIGRCTVCMDDFSEVISLVSTQCGHLFCEACMKCWVEADQRSCPSCRSTLGFNYYSRLHF